VEAAWRRDGGEGEDWKQDITASRESKTADTTWVGQIRSTGAESGRQRGGVGWERCGSMRLVGGDATGEGDSGSARPGSRRV
jgi:hypothetical protein